MKILHRSAVLAPITPSARLANAW